MARFPPDCRLIRCFLAFCLLMFTSACTAAADDMVFESIRANRDVTLSTDPGLPFWQAARPVFAERSTFGEPRPRYRTEVRSRWTKNYLYFLFTCPWQELNLKPDPSTTSETFELWNWDVAEVFIGSDFQNIRRYKEFELSPQAEWIDLDIDLANPHHENGWTWNSGFTVAARIDRSTHTWYGAMRIPFTALTGHPATPDETFRINLFRTEGPASRHIEVVWQPTMSHTFHVPEKFGLLRLSPRTIRQK